VAQQLTDYLRGAGLLPDLQCSYRAFHSTETAVLKVMSDILWATDNGNFNTFRLHTVFNNKLKIYNCFV